MIADPLKLDPTGTSQLRNAFLSEMQRRCLGLERAVALLVEKENVFGLTTNTRWAFLNNPDKVKAFQAWLKKLVTAGVLEVDDYTKKPWLAEYIESAYKKATIDAWNLSHVPGSYASLAHYTAARDEFLRSSFALPIRTSNLERLYTRSFELLKDYTSTMAAQTSVILAEGLAHGKGAFTIARSLRNAISGLTKRRAETIARTEIIYAYAEGGLDTYEQLGMSGVAVQAEWQTAGDGKVCALCRPLDGAVMSIAKARGLLPRHPNCRCAWLPANVGETEPEQKRGRSMAAAVRKSVQAERPKATKEKAVEKSRWAGADQVANEEARIRLVVNSCRHRAASVVHNEWSEEARQAAIEARRRHHVFQRSTAGSRQLLQKQLEHSLPPARAGSQADIINRAIQAHAHTDPQTAADIARLAHMKVDRVRAHLASLEKKKMVLKIGTRYVATEELKKELGGGETQGLGDAKARLQKSIDDLLQKKSETTAGEKKMKWKKQKEGGYSIKATSSSVKDHLQKTTGEGIVERASYSQRLAMLDDELLAHDKTLFQAKLDQRTEHGEADQTFASLHQALTTHDPTQPTVLPMRQSSVTVNFLAKHEENVGGVITHGMSDMEEMKAVTIDGVHVRYPESLRKRAAEDLAVLSRKMHEGSEQEKATLRKLWGAQEHITYTTQLNSEDEHWAKKYKMPGFKSHATGGDNGICVYRSQDLGFASWLHEAGHNAAVIIWGRTGPPELVSSYGRTLKLDAEMRVTNAVSSYGRNSPAEDFAEAVMMYVTESRTLESRHPEKHKVLVGLLT